MEMPRVVVVMGVAGCGKSTVGALLASAYGGSFHDADEFHPLVNIAKMAAGLPLNDSDRAPWLERLRREVIDAAPAGGLSVLACSALKEVYRERLGVGTSGVGLVYLKGDAAILTNRLAARSGHYMKAGMLESQLAILEEPLATEGFSVGIDSSVGEIVAAIGAEFNLQVSP
jgi:gluconokinase